MATHRIDTAALPLVPWRNNQGLTREIATCRAPDGRVLAQLGMAELRGDAMFSDFSGLDRLFTPLGPGVQLRFQGGPWLDCTDGCPVCFDGGTPPELRLLDGPARAFNVLIDQRTLQASVQPLLLLPGTTLPPLSSLAACFCVAGMAGPLSAGDALLTDGPVDLAVPVDGWAKLILVQITPRPGCDATWTGWEECRRPDPAPPG